MTLKDGTTRLVLVVLMRRGANVYDDRKCMWNNLKVKYKRLLF